MFREGYKFMQIKNNHDKEVFNGDIGRIITLDLAIAVNNAKTRQGYTFLDVGAHGLSRTTQKNEYKLRSEISEILTSKDRLQLSIIKQGCRLIAELNRFAEGATS
jgi:hypothetical protein